jgi:hypothetical protein
MPTAAQKSSRIVTSERLKARLAQRDAVDVEPFDVLANEARKRRLCDFWDAHKSTFAQWLSSHEMDAGKLQELRDRDVVNGYPLSNDDTAMRLLDGPRILLEVRHSNPHIAACHSLLAPELALEWLCAPDVPGTDTAPSPPRSGLDDPNSSDVGWPPPARGLRWLFESRCKSTSAEDDLADIAAVKRARASVSNAPNTLPSFPGLSAEQVDSAFCGLGNGFALPSPIGPSRSLARGEEVFAIGAPKLDILMAELQGKLARLDDFRWAIYRQETTYNFLNAAAARFLELVGAKAAMRTALPAAAEDAHGDVSADAALIEAMKAMDLDQVRNALEAHADAASPDIVCEARAARDRLVKKARKARAKVKVKANEDPGDNDSEN